jgi:2-polyprenyl-3-methyl-5-hydroxy-6-metoxy-1,4-benzoquinol methylase
MENQNLDLMYSSYADWKGWLSEKSFFTLTQSEEIHFINQFKKVGIEYKDKRILDFGFGPGNLLKFFFNNNCNIEGVEIQESLLKAAKKYDLNVYASINEISNEKYDIITAIDVLEHMTIEQIKEFLEKASTLLKQNGSLIFRFPNGESPASMPAQNGDYTHLTSIGITKLNQLVEPFGLKIAYYDGEFEKAKMFPLNIIRKFSRYFFSKMTGMGNPYFFYCNVVAVVNFK